jgi:hypothetical protein
MGAENTVPRLFFFFWTELELRLQGYTRNIAGFTHQTKRNSQHVKYRYEGITDFQAEEFPSRKKGQKSALNGRV